jgi:hypothetical protein
MRFSVAISRIERMRHFHRPLCDHVILPKEMQCTLS